MSDEELKNIVNARKKAHSRLLALKSETYAKFLEMEAATYKDGRCPKR